MLSSEFIGILVKKLGANLEPGVQTRLSISHMSKLYLALSKVYKTQADSSKDSKAEQKYDMMKQSIFRVVGEAKVYNKEDKLENDSLQIFDVLYLCMPLAIDGLEGDSIIWQKFKSSIFDNQNFLAFRDYATIAQSFSTPQNPQFIDKEFWSVIESYFKEYLKASNKKKDVQALAGVCFSIEKADNNQISQELIELILQSIHDHKEELVADEDFKEIVAMFLRIKSEQQCYTGDFKAALGLLGC
mmetsp:Transcript_5757/g.9861  ORF Transcript_5757/g.9861 Transcript_5757/m.9861 type:complete len:244 (+) Transcript_5757:1595-2326(+)